MTTKHAVLHFSWPANPRRDVLLKPTWRIAHLDLSQADAQRLVDAKPAHRRRKFKVVPQDQMHKYL